MNYRQFIQTALFFFSPFILFSQATALRVEPPSWWAGMSEPRLQLVVHHEDIARTTPIINYPGVRLMETHITNNPNYLFVDLLIDPGTKPGKFPILFEYQRELVATYDYEFRERKPGSKEREGFGNSDVIYLLMPDRFMNGDPANDSIPGMLEGCHPDDPNGRHGGDLQGISRGLDYFTDLGVTTLWLNPVLENNMPKYSYHGYAITDFYEVDARFGGNEAYLQLIEASHEKGLKVIMDMVFNHCGSYHWWMNDLPSEDWIHQFPEFTRSNYRSETVMDPYASAFDKERMLTGWFDKTMPDLNQKNEFLGNYLIQNSIWWIEFADLDGIRMDTYPYSFKNFMVRWIERVKQEYPNLNVVGETWLQKEAHTAYFLQDAMNKDGYNSHLPTVTDFPMHFALIDAFTQDNGWTTGISRLYYVLSQDYLYSDPMNTVVFADNHDLTRFYTSIGEDLQEWKMAMAFLLTTRGIPMIYYGTELLMTGLESQGHGYIRQDWSREMQVSSQRSAVGSLAWAESLSGVKREAYDFLKQLLNWRNGKEVVHSGMLMQFVPQDGIYVYFRYNKTEKIMVVMNNNSEPKTLGTDRFNEMISTSKMGINVIDGQAFDLQNELELAPKSVLILELR